MNDGREDFIPYWLQTGMPALENIEMPGVMHPWEYPWPHTSPRDMWAESMQPTPSAALPPAPPHSALKTSGRDSIAREDGRERPDASRADAVNALLAHLDSGKYWPVAPSVANDQPPSHGFYFPPVPQAPSWDQVPTYSADSTTPGLPQPPYWDSAASPHSALKTSGRRRPSSRADAVNALLEHPDSARYWGAPAASHSASKT